MPQDPPQRSASPLLRLSYTLAAAYTLIGVAMMFWLAPRVPYADQYRFLAAHIRLPFPQDVLHADNGHRELLPNSIRILELELWGANQLLQILVGIALAILCLGLLWRASRGAEAPVRAMATLTCCMGLFWLGNGRKLCHSNESVSMMLVFCWLFIGLRALAGMQPGDGSRRSWVAGISGILATLSFGAGAASFAAFSVVLLRQRASLRQIMPVCIAAALAATALLFGGGGDTATPAFAPMLQAEQMLRWLGAPLVWVFSPLLDADHAARLPTAVASGLAGWIAKPMEAGLGDPYASTWPAAGFGIAGSLGLLWLSSRSPRSALQRTALGMAWFGVGVGMLVVLLRPHYFVAHPDQLTTARYIPWSTMLWTGLLLGFIADPAPGLRTKWACSLGAALCLAPSQVWTGRAAFKLRETAQLTATAAAVGVVDRDFDLSETQLADLKTVIPLLRARRITMFAWPETQTLGQGVPRASLRSVEIEALRVRPADNLLSGPGSILSFHCAGEPGDRLLLLDSEGIARGIAAPTRKPGIWQGWWRGPETAHNLRAAALLPDQASR